jgi:transcriptional regulator with XRE-family HTH domain
VVKTNLGKRISVLRQAAGLTQEKLAEKTDYSVEFISMVERGINAPSVEGCERIASALHIPLKDLFDFDTGGKRGGQS